MEARYYNAQWGRFLQQDPVFLEFGTDPKLAFVLADPQMLNSYSYARNNPIKYIDPNGREPVKKYAGTVSTFLKIMNNSPSKIGLEKGQGAANALIRLGQTQWDWGKWKMAPSTTPYFNTKEGRYIYTEKGGWIDMSHFLFYAGAAYEYKEKGYAYPIVEALTDGGIQEGIDSIFIERSGFSYEDIPSDYFGADFAVNYFDPKSKLTLGEQVQKYLNEKLMATDPKKAPNYDKMPAEDSNAMPSRQNHSTIPVYTKENP